MLCKFSAKELLSESYGLFYYCKNLFVRFFYSATVATENSKHREFMATDVQHECLYSYKHLHSCGRYIL